VALGHITETAGAEARNLTGGLAAGDMTLGRWYRRMRAMLIPKHYEAALLTLGPGALAPIEAQAIRQAANRQVQFLDGFRDAIQRGQQLLDGTAEARAEMYGASIWQTAWNVLHTRNVALGYDEAMRILGSGHPCNTCAILAGEGWMPAEMMPPLGDSECRARCQCSIIYR
jgi:hypothetical protein